MVSNRDERLMAPDRLDYYRELVRKQSSFVNNELIDHIDAQADRIAKLERLLYEASSDEQLIPSTWEQHDSELRGW